MPTIPVFVYGTLKRGYANHVHLRDAVFVGEASTVARYAMHVAGLPMVDHDNPVSPIHGELYRVDRTTFVKLDRLEGHPDLYRRRFVWVTLSVGGVEPAWMYFSPQPRGRIIESGRYEGT